MSIEIEWTKVSVTDLKKLDNFTGKRILKKLRFFSENSSLRNIKKLKGEEAYRLRVGEYRILFDKINDSKIRIHKIGHRKNIYKN